MSFVIKIVGKVGA